MKELYNGGTCAVRVGNDISRPFSVTTGVRQGCILSPFLFNLVIDWIMRQTITETDGVLLSEGVRITDVDYADDLLLLAEDKSSAQDFINRLEAKAETVGLLISAPKTKSMGVCISNLDLTLAGAALEQVPKFK